MTGCCRIMLPAHLHKITNNLTEHYYCGPQTTPSNDVTMNIRNEQRIIAEKLKYFDIMSCSDYSSK